MDFLYPMATLPWEIEKKFRQSNFQINFSDLYNEQQCGEMI